MEYLELVNGEYLEILFLEYEGNLVVLVILEY